MRGMLWRVLIAGLVVAFIYWLLPPLTALLGFPLTGNLFQVVRIVIAGLALWYILFGPTPTRPAP